MAILWRFPVLNNGWRGWIALGLMLVCGWAASPSAAVADPAASAGGAFKTNSGHCYHVAGFTVEGRALLSTNLLVPLFTKYAGTNVSLANIVQAAADLDAAYLHLGYSNMNVVIAPKRIMDGIVTLDVFPGAVAQVVVGGNRYLVSSNGVAVATTQPVVYQATAPPTMPPFARTIVASNQATNVGPRFTVYNYQIAGNSLLPPQAISEVFTNIPGAFGTNVSFDNIREVVQRLQGAYRERGFVTVAVDLPPQRLTNATVQVRVIEGRLDAIMVKGNEYFSSNNVMRAMPGLHPGMMLNGLTFQAELNRANANQDRQISPVIEPGPDPGTSDLTLQVKDRFPLHGKIELNNQNSPGTPDLRVNASAVYDNLWQQEHDLGVQYSFSPEQYKQGSQWDFYDLPSVANYSTFYRIPLGSPGAIDDAIAAKPGSFGYDEATRKVNLPPSSGQPDVTVFASRSTIDTGLTSTTRNLFTATNSDGSPTSVLNEVQPHQDITINNDFGMRLNVPVAVNGNFHMSFSGGLDFKTYGSTSIGTNIYELGTQIIDTSGGSPVTNYNHSSDSTPIPGTYNEVHYVPLSVRYDSGWHDRLGTATFGLGISADLWASALAQQTIYTNITKVTDTSTNTRTGSYVTSVRGAKALQTVSGSRESSGHWVVLNPSFSHTFELVTNWVTTFRADGQWASEPLISNEQFGAGGVNSVRGYQEGEVFGDTGWHVSLEQQTPPHVVGMIHGRIPVAIRGSVFTDYARIYLLDPQGRSDDVALWSTGVGFVASIGSFWQTRFLFSVPLLSTTTTTAYHPAFNFVLTAQF